MKLFGPEHERTLLTLYGDGASEFGDLLRSFSTALEAKVLPLSLALDQGKATVGELRRVLFEQGLCRLAHSGEYGGMGLPFGGYPLAMELAGAADASAAMSTGVHKPPAQAGAP